MVLLARRLVTITSSVPGLFEKLQGVDKNAEIFALDWHHFCFCFELTSNDIRWKGGDFNELYKRKGRIGVHLYDQERLLI